MTFTILTNNWELKTKFSRREFLFLLAILPLLSSYSFNESSFADKLVYLAGKDNCILLSEVKSGKIIGCANKNLINKPFTIGSIAKIITSIALLEEGLISDKEIMSCKGKENIAGKDIICWKPSGHGRLNIESGISESCNIFFYKASLRISPEDILKYYKILNLIPKDLNYKPNNIYEIALGLDKHICTTPLQLLSLVNFLATNGIYKPVWFNNQAESYNIKEKLTIKNSTISIIKNGMISAGQQGTAKKIHSNGYEVAIKTGTAPNDNNTMHGFAVGFVPSVNPKISFCILVKNGTGFSNAVPLVNKVLKLCSEYHYL